MSYIYIYDISSLRVNISVLVPTGHKYPVQALLRLQYLAQETWLHSILLVRGLNFFPHINCSVLQFCCIFIHIYIWCFSRNTEHCKMMVQVMWDETLFCCVSSCWHFKEMWCLHLQGSSYLEWHHALHCTTFPQNNGCHSHNTVSHLNIPAFSATLLSRTVIFLPRKTWTSIYRIPFSFLMKWQLPGKMTQK